MSQRNRLALQSAVSAVDWQMSYSETDMQNAFSFTVGILQNMVNPSLAPTQPEGSELPSFSYGGEGIPRALTQYRFSPHGYIFPIW